MKRVLVLVLTLVMVIGLAGVADTTITLAEEPEDAFCAECEGKGPDEGTAGITAAGCGTSNGGLLESGAGYIVMDVDCWHKGGPYWTCDEYQDYNCTTGGYGPIVSCCFSDLVPAGNIVTKIQAVYYGTSCVNGTKSVYVNDNLVGSGFQGGAPCAGGQCDPITVTSADYPDGFPGYVYGGTNELRIAETGRSCLADVHLKIYYEFSLSAILERLAAAEAKLHGEVQPRLDDLEAKDAELQAKDEELQAKDEELQAKDEELQAKDEELENRLAAVEAKLHEEVQPRLAALEAAESCVKAVVDWLIEHVIPSGLINQAEKKGHPMPECP